MANDNDKDIYELIEDIKQAAEAALRLDELDRVEAIRDAMNVAVIAETEDFIELTDGIVRRWLVIRGLDTVVGKDTVGDADGNRWNGTDYGINLDMLPLFPAYKDRDED